MTWGLAGKAVVAWLHRQAGNRGRGVCLTAEILTQCRVLCPALAMERKPVTKDARLWLGLRAEGVPTCECAREQQQRRACRGSAAGGAQMQIRRAVEKPKFGQVSGLVGFHPRCTLLRVGGGGYHRPCKSLVRWFARDCEMRGKYFEGGGRDGAGLNVCLVMRALGARKVTHQNEPPGKLHLAASLPGSSLN